MSAEIPDEDASLDREVFSAVFGPRWRMLIIGGGQLSRYLAEFALALDYQVLISEPREEYRRSWSVAGTTVTADMPDDAVQQLKPDRRMAVVAASHDPKLDDLALIDALRTDALYVGAVGSRANSASRRERLRSFGLGDAQVGRLRGPAGVPIGSRTPPEIALSILAEITACRHGVALPRAGDQSAGASAATCPGPASAP